MEITLCIRGQELTAHYPPIYSGSVGVLRVRLAEIDFDETLVKAVRFKTCDSDWYTADIIDCTAKVPHEVIASGGFDIALAGYENADGKLARFLPTNSVHIDVAENGYGDPDAPLKSEGDPESYTAKIEKLTSDATAKAESALSELSKKAAAETVYTKAETDSQLDGKVDKEDGKGLSANDYTDMEKEKLEGKADLSLLKRLIPQATASGSSVTLTDHARGIDAVNYRIFGSCLRETAASGDSAAITAVGDPVTDENDANYGKYKIGIVCEPKNLISLSGRTVVDNWAFANTNKRTLTGNQIIKGFAASNYAIPQNVTISEATDESITIVSKSNAYGIGIDVEVSPSTEYYISGLSGNIGRIMVASYDKDGGFIESPNKVDNFTFTTPAGAKWVVIALTATALIEGSVGSAITFSEIQLERGSSKSEYEPGSKTENLCIFTNAPLLKDGACADYIDFETQELVRHIGLSSADGSLEILDTPIIEHITTAPLPILDSSKVHIDSDTSVKGSLEVSYYRDIGRLLDKLQAENA